MVSKRVSSPCRRQQALIIPERVPTPGARDDYTPAPPSALHSNAGLLILRSFTW